MTDPLTGTTDSSDGSSKTTEKSASTTKATTSSADDVKLPAFDADRLNASGHEFLGQLIAKAKQDGIDPQALNSMTFTELAELANAEKDDTVDGSASPSDIEDSASNNLFSARNATRFDRPSSSGRRRPQRFDESAPTQRTPTGLNIRAYARSAADMAREHVEIPRDCRGSSDYERQKTRDKVVVALSPRLACSKIQQVLTSSAMKDYDIADDAHRWQHALAVLATHAEQYDLAYLFEMPNFFLLDDGRSVLQATSSINILTDWESVSLEECKAWQAFILKYGSNVDLETDRWIVGLLQKTMEAELKAEVGSDLEDIAKSERGSIVLFRLIATRLFERNQEARDAMVMHIQSFDIRKYDGQHVPTAVLRLKAICRALGDKSLPSNTVRLVLEGMAQATTDSFTAVCNTNLALFSSSLYKPACANLSTSKHLFAVLKDLEKKFTELLEADKWNGVGHEGSAFRASLVPAEYDEARALAARFGKRLSYEEWEKNAICHGCGEKGHIKPNCPHRKLSERERSRRGINHRGQRIRDRARSGSRPRSRPPSSSFSSAKKKSALKAFNALLETLFTSDDEGTTDDKASADDASAQGNDDDDSSSTSSSASEDADLQVNSAAWLGSLGLPKV
mmetsp:Transcript_27606/g.47002  ORF Transcript_27606/g.47002 Transcript_27606/m.47002 type:complete len:625 (-) Transcript_27606:849-2723(-)|eukprot:CAMPEP_0183706734 /NCGR_PEP_ID=MMETSP0737-20130205/3481_1 /TAXON_ID=385413 /ORGANISM="Thalassiosira miniscula, Strain CCMP1093" /LENGTH=624 /DNA_ID=CAMNT_0025934221 /DNA_START=594 /DNA_END=2468 /DNA_ORIENTATION=-